MKKLLNEILLMAFVIAIIIWGGWGLFRDYYNKYTGKCGYCGKKSKNKKLENDFWICDECNK